MSRESARDLNSQDCPTAPWLRPSFIGSHVQNLYTRVALYISLKVYLRDLQVFSAFTSFYNNNLC